jgi:RNA polymerase sigma factor (sigma-70 family)
VGERSDEELLAAASTDESAFAEIYDRHVDAVIAFGVRRLRHPDEVADLVAAVFLAVLRSAAGFDPARGTARAWLYGVASKVLADGRRRGAREAQALARVSGRRLLQPDDYADLESRLDAAALAHRLHALMADLPAGDRAVLELVALDQLTVTEAAAALGIRPVAARARLARARRRLRPRLAAEQGASPAGEDPPRRQAECSREVSM